MMTMEFRLPWYHGLRLLLNPIGLWIWWNAPKRCSFVKYARSCFIPQFNGTMWRGEQ